MRSKFSSNRMLPQDGSVINQITSGAYNQSQFMDLKGGQREPPAIKTSRTMGKANFSGKINIQDNNMHVQRGNSMSRTGDSTNESKRNMLMSNSQLISAENRAQ